MYKAGKEVKENTKCGFDVLRNSIYRQCVENVRMSRVV